MHDQSHSGFLTLYGPTATKITTPTFDGSVVSSSPAYPCPFWPRQAVSPAPSVSSTPHSHCNSSLGPHSSRDSSSNLLSGSLKPHRKHEGSRKGRQPRKDFGAIEE
ncbi:hypothetical protein CRYUN_Cryun12cG0131500 [Craigia yunnanensis]